MKFGARLYGTDPAGLAQMAQRIEELGYESIWRGEHVVIPDQWEESYPYSAEGTAPFVASTPILEPFTLFAHLAAFTSRVKLASGICILPLRDAYVFARTVTTLDILSGGRLLLGVGAGWLSEEFRIVGQDFAVRGQRTTELIQALQSLWSQRTPEFAGTHVTVGGAMFEPKPAATPHPPIIVGGESKAALRRAAVHGDGWYGHAFDVDHIRGQVKYLRDQREEAGRTDQPFTVTVRVMPDIPIDHVQALAAAGVDRAVLEVGSFNLEDPLVVLPQVEDFAGRIVANVEEG